MMRWIAPWALGLSVGWLGCTPQASHDEPASHDDEVTGTAQEADVYFEATPPYPHLDPNCEGFGYGNTVTSPGYPAHATGTCETYEDAFTYDDAVLACGGDVQYFSYSCTDFTGGRHPQYTSTAYYGCCTCNASTCPAPGVCNGNTCVEPQPPATQMVNAGNSAGSAHYHAVYTLGQPTFNQGATSSPSYQVQGGLIGANGSMP